MMKIKTTISENNNQKKAPVFAFGFRLRFPATPRQDAEAWKGTKAPVFAFGYAEAWIPDF